VSVAVLTGWGSIAGDGRTLDGWLGGALPRRLPGLESGGEGKLGVGATGGVGAARRGRGFAAGFPLRSSGMAPEDGEPEWCTVVK